MRRSFHALTAMLTAAVIIVTLALPAAAAQRAGGAEAELLARINQARASAGVSAVKRVGSMDTTAYSWSQSWYENWQGYACSGDDCDMTLTNYAPSPPGYGSGSKHTAAGVWGDGPVDRAFGLLSRSTLLSADLTEVGIGVVSHGDLMFVGVGFRPAASSPAPAPKPAPKPAPEPTTEPKPKPAPEPQPGPKPDPAPAEPAPEKQPPAAPEVRPEPPGTATDEVEVPADGSVTVDHDADDVDASAAATTARERTAPGSRPTPARQDWFERIDAADDGAAAADAGAADSDEVVLVSAPTGSRTTDGQWLTAAAFGSIAAASVAGFVAVRRRWN